MEDCRHLFTPVPTDAGLCCAFNSRAIIRAGECGAPGEATDYACLVKELQAEAGRTDLDDGGAGPGTMDGLRPAGAGRRWGLQVILDQHSNLDSPGTIYSNDNSFKVFIGEPSEFPLLSADHLLLAAGRQHAVRLSATHLRSGAGVRGVPVAQRGCLFPDELDLQFYSSYSYRTCMFECALLHAASEVGCTPWYLPTTPNTTLCTPWQAATFTAALDTTTPSSCPHCLPDCEATTYTTTSSSAPLRRCDSRNMNLNPLCSLATTLEAAPWLEDVASQYTRTGEEVPDYISGRAGGRRSWFAYREDEEQELLVTKVRYRL